MTEAQLYLEVLHILDKQSIPTIRVDDYNIFYNDAVYNFIQLQYKQYDTSQNIADDLRDLSRNIIYTNTGVVDRFNAPVNLFNNNTNNNPNRLNSFKGEAFDLPSDYMHITNCTVKVTDNTCNIQREIRVKKLSDDSEASIIDNEFYKPSRDRVYFQIKDNTIEIMYGDKSITFLDEVSIKYIKFPQRINLQPNQIQPDTSNILEFNDLTIQKIKNELIARVLEYIEHPVRQNTRLPLDQKII